MAEEFRSDDVHCPFCDELIRANAKKCRHCNEWLEDDEGPGPYEGHGRGSDSRMREGYGPGELKSKLAAGLFGIFLGGFGVHRFYLGFIGIAVAQIVVTFATCGAGSLWGLIEGILILAGSIDRDSEGRPLRD